MKRSELKSLIREAIEEVFTEMSSGTTSYTIDIDNNVYPISGKEIEEIVSKYSDVEMKWLGDAAFGTETLNTYSFNVSGPSGSIDSLVSELVEQGDGIDVVDTMTENGGY